MTFGRTGPSSTGPAAPAPPAFFLGRPRPDPFPPPVSPTAPTPPTFLGRLLKPKGG